MTTGKKSCGNGSNFQVPAGFHMDLPCGKLAEEPLGIRVM